MRHTHRPANGLTRRALLADLGRVTLGAVVLGPVLGGCDDAVDGSGSDGAAGGAGADDAGADGVAGTAVVGAWHRASFGFVSAYVLVRDGEALVFDTGTGDDGVEPIGAALQAAGAGWGDVSTVLLSHRHGDHAGGLGALAGEAPDAELLAAMPDLDVVRDRVRAAREVVDGDEVLGLRIVATPGHTLGHVSALDPAAGVLLTGDALVNSVTVGGSSGAGVEGSPPDFTEDAALAEASVRTLASLTFDAALFGHGEPIVAGAAAQVGAYADTL